VSDNLQVDAVGMIAVAKSRSESRRKLRARLLSGSFMMLLSSVFVGGVNLIYNFAIAHALGADKFGHASVVYTMLMLLSSITLSFQLVCSKFLARSESEPERIGIYHLLHRRSWIAGISIGGALALSNPLITGYLNLPSRSFVYLLAGATVFYIPLGVRRGYMQGTYDFRPLAFNFILEVVVKLTGALVLVSAGYGVEGVVGAMTASVAAAYLVAIPRHRHMSQLPETKLHAGMGEGVQAVTFFIGQVVINNLDIILVKHFFDPTAAGVYAAVALAGRVVYMLSWSVVNSMFPFSAGARSEEQGGRSVLSTALVMVAGIAALFILAVWLTPPALWQALLGHGFPAAANQFYSSLLVLYSVTTAVYSLAVVLMTYEISRKIGNVSWLQLAFSAAIVLGIYALHRSLEQVIFVQLVLMMGLLLTVSVPFLRSHGSESAEEVVPSGLTKLRPVPEQEVVAEFLRSEFYEPEFAAFRERYADLVEKPDLTNVRDNQIRKALLYRRRGRLWRELPPDTEWWEVELTPEEISRMRVFARNQWLRFGPPDFLLLTTADRVRDRILANSSDPFIEKLRSLSIEMAQDVVYSSIILITINQQTPITIIEGNHRMTAAALVAPETLHARFRFLCGFSPRMAECVWYQTNLATLWQYTRNTLTYYFKDRHRLTTEVLKAGSQVEQSSLPGEGLPDENGPHPQDGAGLGS
jgi:O-antigen/teichoic acid export membrane protein